MAKPASEYTRKRNFAITSEPAESKRKGKGKSQPGALGFVIQKHDARNLHYDFRLELEGTLKSWAVPKGPSLDPTQKRLAVHVEDHPLDYAGFEGSIPQGQYGGGDVIVWDRGVWQPHGDPQKTYAEGKLKFTLVGEKLSGDWALVRTRLKGSGSKEQWLLIKEKDDIARPAAEYDITQEQPQSVISGAHVGEERSTPKKSAASAANGKAKASTSKSKAPKPAAKPTRRKAKSAFPDTLSPQLATLVEAPPAGDWLYEIKFDGYRMLTRIEGADVRLFTRNGHDWTERLPELVKALKGMKLRDSWFDGEVVVLDEQGLPDFQGLQNAFDAGNSKDILYYLFDMPFLSAEDLREVPLEQRRDALKHVVDAQKSRLLRYSDAFQAGHQDIVASAAAMGLEGVIGKRAGSAYVSKRNADWIKLKCRLRQEFVVVGYTAPQGSRSAFGALLLAVNAGEDGLVYAGRVGTGFTEVSLEQLHKQLKKLQRKDSPLAKKLSASQARGVQWVEPKLVCETEFAQWTREGIVRQAAFVGLRNDKPAKDVVREDAQPAKVASQTPTKTAAPQARKKAAQGKVDVAGTGVSHPDRIIDSKTGTSKIELAQFYESIADWILPYLNKRPVALLRCPEGIDGEQFFQKHAEHLAIPHIRQLDRALDPGHAALMEIDSLPALIGAAQMGAIELHTWGATRDRIETPDHFVLDLDPDPALPWRSMIEATQMVLAVLEELGLEAFLKTSGGKGMHIIVPLARQADWDTVKAFAKAIAEFASRQLPERFTATMGPKNRVGKIFIDYLRNSRGGSTVTAYSVRARPGLPVSVPIALDELAGLKSSAQWDITNLEQRLKRLKDDPWAGYSNRRKITQKMWKQLGAKRP
ncbi:MULTISPECIES: DNA ligase D [Pseudomonas]|jgi:bifunctional non-homologous end joining protein LigD|uniref:DNA ligase (ATP) n=1 Tax=Pseudomonas syringae Cit 7 TaxID=629264 RepID=A0A8T8LRZ6_PSESX|nr:MULTISPECIES: DNA ligase D [Pseudomonas]AKF50856.1 ATP-dependent DNA ligase LigD phosphoesterase module / ATP-dependent DNA ligase LigD polymerase module [Pseudomonas syringae pv. syringae HS191]KTC01780.1 ATP-dependent DNA ligase [Pseudomonas sp. ICMP 10191]MCH5653763.1 DNA ligase D [Pseudomonas syringae]MCK9697853.1 DNA ligase D [Pseudomonas syringae pv. syringae]MCK9703516.1 DNA ligase D [Pseudomonas syringae pv. syringae]